MRSDGSSFLDRLSKKTVENLLYLGMAAVLVIGAGVHVLVSSPENSADLFIALNPDGSSESQLHTSFVWFGPTPLRETTFSTSAALLDDRWFDGAGRVLDVKTEPRDTGGSTMRVQFAEPVFPNERVELKNTNRTTESVVKREGQDYVYKTSPGWGGRPYALSYTVTLPKGAKVVSTQPDTDWRCISDDRTVLHFKWTEKPHYHPNLSVRYSLPQA